MLDRDMAAKDEAALEEAMKIASKDPMRAEQLKHFLDGDKFNPPVSWWRVAKFAASLCQRDSLKLQPWEPPPCRAHRDPLGVDAAGISQWHPSPMDALRQAKQAKRTAKC